MAEDTSISKISEKPKEQATEVPPEEFIVVECDGLDPNFREEVAREHGGENIRKCFQCGTCVAMCPVAEQDPRYDPRRIIRMVNLGMRKEVLSGPAIWLCSGCYNCFERCPQDVKPTQILQAIQHIASREGYTHKAFKAAIGLLCQRGRLIEVSEFDNRTRKKLTLPEIKEDAGPTKAIVENQRMPERAAEKKPEEKKDVPAAPQGSGAMEQKGSAPAPQPGQEADRKKEDSK